MLEWVQMDQCKPSGTPADLNLKLQTAQNGDEEVDQRICRSFGWITSVSGQTDEARHHVHSQHSVQTHECTYQSKLDVR